MDETAKKLLILQYCPSVTWKDQYLLLKHDPYLREMPHLTAAEIARITGRSIKQAQIILHEFNSVSYNHLYSSLTKSQTTFVPIFDERYPEPLKRLPQPPWVLFAIGDVRLMKHDRILAVVGARNGDEYGRKALQAIIPGLVEKHISIISGLAKGIDAFSHEEALNAGGKTIAVIAGGFQHFYPKENIALARQIARDGLILSEYAPHIKPERWQFPARNRIVSGLSGGVLIVQAAKKSGSLITANFAMEQGIDVFAVPGPITHPLSEGVHSLIADGAKIVHCADDILVELGV